MRIIVLIFMLFSFHTSSFADIIISEIYGGATTTSPYSRDYVVIANNGVISVDISGYKLYYGSAANGNAPALAATVPTTTNLAAGASFVIALAASAGNTNPSTPYGNGDLIASTNMGGAAGRVYLTSGAAPDNACSPTNTLGDVFYGTQTTCLSNAPAPSSTSSIISSDGVNFTSNPLPVSLTFFRGNRSANSISLAWQTASETNNSHFILERSNNGRTFQTIATIAGAGNSSTSKDYAYTDSNPLRGSNYYRLRQVDFDGKYTFSSIISIFAGKVTGKIISIPNPTTATIHLVIPDDVQGTYEVSILDLLGKEIIKQTITTNEKEVFVDISELRTGIYVASINNANFYFNTFVTKL